jgi:hypothetical protein
MDRGVPAQLQIRGSRESVESTQVNIDAERSLSDKGKPVARRGRKAADQETILTAGLPKKG